MSKELSIDEILYLFKGKSKYQQKVKNKLYSTGLKFFTLTNQSGFICDTFLYHKKDTKEVQIFQLDSTERETSTTLELIEYFLKRIKSTNHMFFMDQYYGSSQTMDLLHKYNHYGVLNCMANRSSEIFSNSLHTGLYYKIFIIFKDLQQIMTELG